MNNCLEFLKCEDGAVTVDWVVLTAAIVGLSVAVLTSIGAGATNVSSSLGAGLSAAEAKQISFVLMD